MWSAEQQLWHVGLSESQVAITPPVSLWTRSHAKHAIQILASPATAESSPIWQASTTVLADWLNKGSGRRRLRIHLSAKFVRWLLIPWSPQLASTHEVQAYAELQLRATFGEAAIGWRLGLPPLSPGRPLLACAIDDALLSTLDQFNSMDGVSVQHVGPHFSAAFDHWRRNLRHESWWFAVLESNAYTLALSYAGLWRGIRTQRLIGNDINWLQQLQSDQALMRMSWEEDSAKKLPLFMVNCSENALENMIPESQWLKPVGRLGGVNGSARLAWGV